MTDLVEAGKYDVDGIGNFAQLIAEELGADFNPNEAFKAIRFPSGGGTAFEDPFSDDPDSPDLLKDITGVVIADVTRTVTYFTSFDDRDADDSRPDLWSRDGVTQVVPERTIELIDELNKDGGNRPYPSVDLAACPYNQWGSKQWTTGGEGSATSQYLDLYVLLEGRPFPVKLVVPQSSIKAWKQYKQTVLFNNSAIAVGGIETTIKIVKDENKAGITFSKAKFAAGSKLPQDEITKLKAFGKQIKDVVVGDPLAALSAPAAAPQIAAGGYAEPKEEGAEPELAGAGVAAAGLDL